MRWLDFAHRDDPMTFKSRAQEAGDALKQLAGMGPESDILPCLDAETLATGWDDLIEAEVDRQLSLARARAILRGDRDR